MKLAPKLKLLSHTAFMARFYRDVLSSKILNAGVAVSFTAFLIRAYVNGSLIPLTTKNITDIIANRLQRGANDWSSIISGIYTLFAVAALFVATEWMLKLYFDSLVDTIVRVKTSLASSLLHNGNNGRREDVVGRIASDVDYVVWNFNGVYTTLVPNMLTTVVSTTTLVALSPSIALLNLTFTIPVITLTEFYLRRIEVVRAEERTRFSESLYYANELVKGNIEAKELFASSLKRWNRAIKSNILLDRVYWSTSLASAMAAISVSTYIASKEAFSGRISPGSVAGIISAAFNFHFPLINGLWALCVLGQTVPAMKRIAELVEETRRSSPQPLIAPTKTAPR